MIVNYCLCENKWFKLVNFAAADRQLRAFPGPEQGTDGHVGDTGRSPPHVYRPPTHQVWPSVPLH